MNIDPKVPNKESLDLKKAHRFVLVRVLVLQLLLKVGGMRTASTSFGLVCSDEPMRHADLACVLTVSYKALEIWVGRLARAKAMG